MVDVAAATARSTSRHGLHSGSSRRIRRRQAPATSRVRAVSPQSPQDLMATRVIQWLQKLKVSEGPRARRQRR